MEKFVALTLVSAVMIFAGTYALAVAKSHGNGK
jgi:hypothetical protein